MTKRSRARHRYGAEQSWRIANLPGHAAPADPARLALLFCQTKPREDCQTKPRGAKPSDTRGPGSRREPADEQPTARQRDGQKRVRRTAAWQVTRRTGG